MKLVKFKNKIGLNLFALFGYLPIVILIFDYCYNRFHFLLEMGIFIYGLALGCLLALSLVIWIIELLCKHEIKNKYIIENKMYNIFWIIGFISASLCFMFFIYMVVLGTIQYVSTI